MTTALTANDLPHALLVIAPHPDDEVLGCGELMRRVASHGGRVGVVWMTDGGASHGDLGPEARSMLVARRQTEALEGLVALGVAPVATAFLGYPDGGLADADIEATVSTLQALCDRHRFDTVVVTAADDDHADHRAAFAIARRLTIEQLYTYPVSARYDGEPFAPPSGSRVVSPIATPHKRAALARHRSQHDGEGARYPLSSATIERFCSEPEFFLPVERGAR